MGLSDCTKPAREVLSDLLSCWNQFARLHKPKRNFKANS